MANCKECRSPLSKFAIKNRHTLCGACRNKKEYIPKPDKVINGEAYCPYCNNWKLTTKFPKRNGKPDTGMCNECNARRAKCYRYNTMFKSRLSLNAVHVCLYGADD